MTDRKITAGRLRGYLKKGDIIVICVLLGLSLLAGIASALSACPAKDGGSSYAVVTRGGVELARMPLSEDCRYVVSDADVRCVIETSDGAVRMAEADCPDRLCVASGPKSERGQVIVCLPNEIVIRVESEDDAAVDSTAY